MANEVLMPDVGVSFADPRVAVTRPETATTRAIQQTGEQVGELIAGTQQLRTKRAAERIGDVLNVAHGVSAAGGSFDPETGDVVLPEPASEQQAANFAALEARAADVKRKSTEAFGQINRMIQQTGGSLQAGGAAARTLVEREMRRLTGQTPGFANEIRQAASEVLGFDPTGGTLQALFNYTDPTTSKQKTILDTDVGKAALEYQAISQGQGVNLSFQEALQMASDDELKVRRIQNLQQQVEFGEASVPHIVNEMFEANRMDMQGFIKNHIAKVSQQGLSGWDASVSQSALDQYVQENVQATINSVNKAGGVLDNTQISQLTERYEAQTAPYRRLIESGTMENLTTSQLNVLKNMATLRGAQIQPGWFVASQAWGEGTLNTLIEAMDSVTNPGQLSLLVEHYPKVKALFGDQSGNVAGLPTGDFANMTGKAFTQVLEGPGPQGTYEPITGDAETDQQIRAMAVDAATNTQNPKDFRDFWKRLGTTSPKMAISTLANKPNKFNFLNEGEKTEFRGTVARNWMELIDNLAANLDANGGQINTVTENRPGGSSNRYFSMEDKNGNKVFFQPSEVRALNTVYRKLFSKLGKEITGGNINTESDFEAMTKALVEERRLQIRRDALLQEKANQIARQQELSYNPDTNTYLTKDGSEITINTEATDVLINSIEEQLDTYRRRTRDVKNSLGIGRQ